MSIREQPELMALYNEVQTYYDHGLQIPDDVTLLFADDNFSSLRRLPNKEEKQRRGGSGVCIVLPEKSKVPIFVFVSAFLHSLIAR